ncbi:hypothetical protein B0H13DRAFT_2367466 [Mycena leptocephala]|nr:hypothetical protein B0H13DRAFT_2367466 [Mycena leptocephala]
MASNTTSNSDTPALPAVRVPQANENSMDAAMAEPAGLVAPLPSLRTPARANTQEDVAPLPTIQNTIVHMEIPYDQQTVGGAAIEETEQVQNPVTPQGGQVAAVNSPFLTPSTERSMVGQTMWSFESHPGTATRAKAPAESSTTALTRTGSSSTVVTFDNVAPSDLEIYSQAGLVPTSKGEKVTTHRMRTAENELRLCTCQGNLRPAPVTRHPAPVIRHPAPGRPAQFT